MFPFNLKRSLVHMLVVAVLLFAGACEPTPAPRPTPTRLGAIPSPQLSVDPQASEQPVRLLTLAGPLQAPQAELSGLAWHGDDLILLPQYPERFTQPTADESYGALFTIPKAEILAYLSGKTIIPLTPRPVPLFAPGLKQKVSGYEGFESIVFSGNRVYFTIETHQAGGMLAVLVGGEISPDLSQIVLDMSHLVDISAQAPIPNFSDEAITLVDQQLITFYEGNGARVTPHAVAHVFDLDLNPRGVIPSPALEYRITDATPIGDGGRFWVINYFYPGDTQIAPNTEPLFERYGIPPSHRLSKAVERLIQLQWESGSIRLVPRAPLYLQLMPDGTARNWEGLAQLDELGFLMVTDSFPSTLFGFVQLQ
jgi:hypothetical protein